MIGVPCGAQEAKQENVAVEKVITEDAAAENPASLQQRMMGVWVLAGKPSAEVEPQPGARMKFFGLGYWVITEHSPYGGEVICHHGGTYTLDGNNYTETITFATEKTEQMIGSEFKFTIAIEDGKYTQIGEGNPFSEVWIRPQDK